MRVLHILKSNSYSGAEHVVCNIIKNINESYDCIYVSPDGVINDRLKKEGVNHYTINDCSDKEIRRAVMGLKPDVVHAHDFTASVMAALACNSCVIHKNIKIISHLHCNPTWLQTKNLKTWIFKQLRNRFDKVLIVSEAVKEDYVYSDLFEEKFLTVGNPFSMQEIIDKASESDDAPECDVIYVGRLSDEKNPLMFIEIINALKQEIPNVKAMMIGDGDLMEECKTLIDNYGLNDNIEMLGFKENPYIYIKNSRVICIPSKWEGFGLVALEAMALGVPVVCSGAGGLNEISNKTSAVICKDENQYVEEILSIVQCHYKKEILIN